MSAKRTLLLQSPVHWVFDWDGTITKKDTLNTLVNIAASNKPHFPTLDRWNTVVDAYISDYTSALKKLAPGGALPKTIAGEKKLLRDLKVVEQRSLDRVFEAKIFEHMTKEQIEKGAMTAVEKCDVLLRPGCLELLQHLSKTEGDRFHILSVNWSRCFISSCLKTVGADIDTSSILANELDGIMEGLPSSGQVSPDKYMKIIASEDKLHRLEEMRKASPASIVYVGDSGPDIECLLAADLGICIRNEPMQSSQKTLAEALDRLGVACPHLSEREATTDSSIAWARDFVEIQHWTGSHGCGVEQRVA